MEDRRQHIDDLFREGLDEYQEVPGADVWTSLEQRLPAAAVEERESSYRWLWWLLLIALLATVGYYTINKISKPSGGSGNTPVNQTELTTPGNNISTIQPETAKEPSLPTNDHNSGHLSAIHHNTANQSSSISTSGNNSSQAEKPGIKEEVQQPANTKEQDIKGRSRKATTVSTDKSSGILQHPSADNQLSQHLNSKSTPSINTNKNNRKPENPTPSPISAQQPVIANNKETNPPSENVSTTDNSIEHNTQKATKNSVPASGNKKTHTATNSNRNSTTTTAANNQQESLVSNTKTNTTKTGLNNPRIDKQSGKKDKPVSKKGIAKTNDNPAEDRLSPAKNTSDETSNQQATANNKSSDNKVISSTRKKANKNKESRPVKIAANNIENKQKITPSGTIAKTEKKQADQASANAFRNNKDSAQPDITNDPNNEQSTKPVTHVTTQKNSSQARSNKDQAEKATNGNAKRESDIATNPPKTIGVVAAKSSPKDLTVKGIANTQKKPRTTKPATSKGHPVSVTSEPSENKEIEVSGATSKKKISDPTADAFEKSNSSQAENAAVTTKSGMKVNSNASAAKTRQEKKTEGVALQKYIEEETKEEAKIPDDEFVQPSQPDQKNTASGSGGSGGSSEPRFELRNFNGINLNAGLKLAYDRGFNNYTTSNFVISPYLQWNISSRFALVLQPGFRYNQINKTSLLDKQAYHLITNAVRDSNHITFQDTFGTKIQRTYLYKNTYDSIVAGYSMKSNNYWEIELPLYAKYYITDNFSVMAGGLLSFGKIMQIEGNIQRYSGLTRYDSIYYQPVYVNQAPYPNPPSVDNYFSYNTPVFTNQQKDYDNPTSNPARFGILFGFSYEFNRKILLDLMVRKTVSSLQFIPNEQVRTIYSQPYFRFSIGYKLFDSENKKAKHIEGL